MVLITCLTNLTSSASELFAILYLAFDDFPPASFAQPVITIENIIEYKNMWA